jgi:hypothetical protein
MKPVKFPGCNRVLGENQPQYIPLPIIAFDDEYGTVISCFELTDEEIKIICKSKRLYIQCSTFNEPLQPILPMVDLSDNVEIVKESQYEVYRRQLIQLLYEGTPKNSLIIRAIVKLMLISSK